MAKGDEYEIVNSSEVSSLKQELDAIKKNPFIAKQDGKELKSSIDGLQQSLSQMLDIFKKASDEMTLEEKEERMIARQIKPIISKIEKIVDQNETIAEGIVTIAEKTEDTQKKVEGFENKMDAMMTRMEQLEHAQMSVSSHPSSPPGPSFDTNPPDLPQMPNQMPPMQDFSGQNMQPPPSGMPSPGGLPPLSGGPSPGTGPSNQNMPPPGNSIPPLAPNQLENDNKKKKLDLGSLFKK
ncbi:MAG: hypothetical protein ACOCWQ_02040 [Nanoarchaeota archaeon]